MDTTPVNREIEMMRREGMDPAAIRETIRIQMERKARFGVIAVVCMMVGLGAIAMFPPAEMQSAQAGFGPERGAAGMAAPAATTDEAILWFAGADGLTTVAANDTQITR